MSKPVILLLGAFGSAIMGLLDYASMIFVNNWYNLIPFGVSVLIVFLSFRLLDLIGDVAEIFD